MKELTRDVIGFIMVPAWIKGPRKDLQLLLKDKTKNGKQDKKVLSASICPFVTHELMDPHNDKIVNHIKHAGFCNEPKIGSKLYSYLHTLMVMMVFSIKTITIC